MKLTPVLRVTVEDLETGTTEVLHVPAGNHVCLVTEPLYVASAVDYPKAGTLVLTLKTRSRAVNMTETRRSVREISDSIARRDARILKGDPSL